MLRPQTLWEGRLPLVISILFAAAIWIYGGAYGKAGLLLPAFVLWFFRDPHREPPGEIVRAVLSPADGRVTAVEEASANPLPGEDWPLWARWRISIFLSVFDVHVNRAPLAARVVSIEHAKGEFRDARDPQSAKKNERMTWRLDAGNGRSVEVRQITGAIARRIVAWRKEGDMLASGERFGMIRFGSRTDLFLPADFNVLVSPGDRVRGGLTVVAGLLDSPLPRASAQEPSVAGRTSADAAPEKPLVASPKPSTETKA